jgi:hypothetical protein
MREIRFMDRSELVKGLEGMTDEQLLELINARGKKDDTPKEKVKVQLQNGEVVEGATAEEVNAILAAKYNQATKPDEEVEQVTNGAAPKLPKFAYEKFSKTFVDDPLAGLDYADESTMGFSSRKVLPVMVQTMATLLQQVQDLQSKNFKPYQEHPAEIEQVMKERGWQKSPQALEDAYMIAQGKGLIKTEKQETKKEEPTFLPPRVGKRSTESLSTTEQEVLSKAETMDLSDLEDILRQAGRLKTGVL